MFNFIKLNFEFQTLKCQGEEEKVNQFINKALKLVDNLRSAIDLALMCANGLIKVIKVNYPEEFSIRILPMIEERPSEFSKLCLFTGCLNYGPAEVTLTDLLFPMVLNSCQAQCSHTYQSFQALRLWSSKARRQKSEIFTRDRDKFLPDLLRLINSNWENPVRGVPDLVAEAFENTLHIANDPRLDSVLLEEALRNLSWKSKAKYPMLLVLLPRVGVLQTLQKEGSEFGRGLCQSLQSNHLASAGASVYKCVIETPGVLPFWRDFILPHFVASLCSKSESSFLGRCNGKNHWLHPTLSHLPAMEAAALMREKLCECAACCTAGHLILKGLRMNGHVLELEERHINDLREGLGHSNSDVRSAAFAALCHVKKKAILPTTTELQMVTNFVLKNLNVDEPAFRQVS